VKKRERLDQILVRRGIATEEQIRQALMRQRTHGGRLGSHLLYYKSATEKELVEALMEQFSCPGVELTGRTVPAEVAGKVPLKLQEEKCLFPFQFEPDTRTLHLAMADPSDEEAVQLCRQAAGARELQAYVAEESVIRNAIRVHFHGRSWEGSLDHVVEMPDLFGDDPGPDPLPEPEPDHGRAAAEGPRDVVLVTRKGFLKTFLGPVFEREGVRLRVLADPAEFGSLAQGPSPGQVLLSEEMEEAFQAWRYGPGAPPRLHLEVTGFSRVSDSLMEQAVGYPQMIRSLLLALEQLAEMQCGPAGWKPPYGAMQQEAGDLARAAGLSRTAADGLRIATLLLVPAPGAPFTERSPDTGFNTDCFRAVVDCMSRAKAIFFPWEVDVCLRSFLDLLSGNAPKPSPGPQREDHRLAPQILAVVWYRHLLFPPGKGAEPSAPEPLRCGLRGLEPRGVSAEVVEAYLRLLSRRKRFSRPWVQHDVFLLVREGTEPRGLGARLRSEGYRVVEVREVDEALHLYRRKRPDAIVADHDAFPEQLLPFCREVQQDARTLLFAITQQTRPAMMLRLLDSGFHDVLSPPFYLELITTRINSAVDAMERRERMALSRKGFSGSFRDLPFVDLVQALSLSQRTVRIELYRQGRERARLHLRSGHLSHALCGDAEGVEAVYRVIRWGEEGTFRLEAAEEFPPDNITVPTDFVLLEGVRQMDEDTA